MKLTFSVLFALLTICLVGCNKADYKITNEEVPGAKLDKKLKGCTSSSLYGVDNGDYYNPFRKTFDESGRVTMIVAPEFALGLLDSLFLQVHYGDNIVYFINQNDLTDTVSTAVFNQQGKLQVIYGTDKHSFSTTEFFYTGNKLTSIETFGIVMEFQYDANGNVISYTGSGEDGLDDYEFTYDLSTEIKQQVYVDFVAGWIYNNFTLAQIMGWTPDLNPVNKRTNTKIYYDNTDIWYNTNITDHVVDADGKLISYKLGGYQMYLSWTCMKGNVIN